MDRAKLSREERMALWKQQKAKEKEATAKPVRKPKHDENAANVSNVGKTGERKKEAVQPLARKPKPESTKRQPVSSTDKPASTKRQPVSSTDVPEGIKRQPVSSTDKPASTTRQHVSSTPASQVPKRRPAKPSSTRKPMPRRSDVLERRTKQVMSSFETLDVKEPVSKDQIARFMADFNDAYSFRYARFCLLTDGDHERRRDSIMEQWRQNQQLKREILQRKQRILEHNIKQALDQVDTALGDIGDLAWLSYTMEDLAKALNRNEVLVPTFETQPQSAKTPSEASLQVLMTLKRLKGQ